MFPCDIICCYCTTVPASSFWYHYTTTPVSLVHVKVCEPSQVRQVLLYSGNKCLLSCYYVSVCWTYGTLRHSNSATDRNGTLVQSYFNSTWSVQLLSIVMSTPQKSPVHVLKVHRWRQQCAWHELACQNYNSYVAILSGMGCSCFSAIGMQKVTLLM